MNYRDKIAKAKAKLMLDHPYFGTIASSLQIEKSGDIESFISDGATLQYSDDYFDEARVEDIEFALANGAMHAILKHQARVASRQDRLWQLSTDYTINSMLLANGLELPPRANYQERFEGMYAEEIYEILRSEISDEEIVQDESTEPQDDQDGLDRQRDQAEESQEHRDVEIDEEFLEQVFKKMNRQGTLPKDLKFVIPQAFSHQVDWREILYRYIASHAKSSFSFMPPNRKYLYRGIYLPSLSSDLLSIVIAIDSSGSVDENLLGVFLGEVESITQQYPNYEIDIIVADAKIQSHEIFLPGERLSYGIKGRGGTDFRPVFDYIDKMIDYPTLLLYFTDGMGTFPTEEPPYDLLWVMPEERETPFGEVVLIEDMEKKDSI
ncbi:MAG: VWA-like domain-containing protein [Campylobacterota bacterium]|nr:VWA-like domain-containing protein [Campylobacterota bacterium]